MKRRGVVDAVACGCGHGVQYCLLTPNAFGDSNAADEAHFAIHGNLFSLFLLQVRFLGYCADPHSHAHAVTQPNCIGCQIKWFVCHIE